MSHLVRLRRPLDGSDDLIALPPAGIGHRARLVGRSVGWALEFGDVSASQAATWALAIETAWWPALVSIFGPSIDRWGRLRSRSCIGIVGHTATHLIIDVVRLAGKLEQAAENEGTEVGGAILPPVAVAAMLATAGLPAAAATYTVQPGDTLTSISRRLLGPTSSWRALYQANRQHLPNPDRLTPGQLLFVPEIKPAAGSGQRSMPKEVVVRPGDTLFGLAQRYLGEGQKWRQLWAGIRHVVRSPEQLPVGLRVPMPGCEPPVAVVTTSPPTSPPATPVLLPVSPAAALHPVDRPSRGLDVPQKQGSGLVTVKTSPPAPLPEGRGEVVTKPAPSEPIAHHNPNPVPAVGHSVVPATLSVPTIERPFASHVGASFDPMNVHESFAVQQVSALGTIFNAFGANAAWRISDALLVSGSYGYDGYPLTRVMPTNGRRTEHHGQAMAYRVWPILPHLEVATGVGGEVAGFGVVADPPDGRPADLYDRDDRRLLMRTEAKVGWRPFPDVPLTLTGGVSAVPIGQGLRSEPNAPLRLWGVGWSAGLRYSVHGVAWEAGYSGQRLFGDAYSQSTDTVQTGFSYYFH